MRDYKYHKESLKKYRFLITGGAGFIGSHLVEYLVNNGAGLVRVIDDLSNGNINNLKKFDNKTNFEFIEGNIINHDLCKKVVQGIDFVSHQAAKGSVPRSIEDPISTNASNVTGFLNLINSCKESKSIKNFVYASSSSVYGNNSCLLKIEGDEGEPLSPYALTKVINEKYAQVFYELFGFRSIGLRYFNIFGPNQNFNNPYAAVIPIFLNKISNGISPTINGDGSTVRDFTFVQNAVQANILSLLNDNINEHMVFNVGCGNKTSLNQLVNLINKICLKNVKPIYGSERLGDVRFSVANISKANKILDYNPNFSVIEGLKITLKEYL